MGGQVLGGGVIVLVAVALWLVYLLPSWHGRHQFNAAERNAVRLSQALRVLAETSETPEEVRIELNARTALAHQRLAKQAQSERAQADLARARAELAATTARAKADAAVARERAAALAREAHARPASRRARARRRARLAVSLTALVALALGVVGVLQWATTGASGLLWGAAVLLVASAVLLGRLSAVQRRAVRRVAAPVAPRRVAGDLQDVDLAEASEGWMPRELPRPLTASAGSRAATVLDEAAAREALRRAAFDEAIRAREQAQRPPSIATARTRREDEFAGGPAAGDDAIEAHVRQLLARRASGQ